MLYFSFQLNSSQKVINGLLYLLRRKHISRVEFLSRRLWKAAVTRASSERKFGQSLPCSIGRVPLPQGYVRGVGRNDRTLAQLGNNCVGGQPLARVDNWFPLIPLSRLPLERHPRTVNWRDVYPAPISKLPSYLASSYFQTIERDKYSGNDRAWSVTLTNVRGNLSALVSSRKMERNISLCCKCRRNAIM